MRPRKTFLYFFNNPQAQSYWRNGYTNTGKPKVVPSTTPRWLKSNPQGWQDNAINFGRNKRLHGINRSFSLPFKFVDDGADIIRARLYATGYEDKLILNINKWAGTDGTSDNYDPYYKGEVDLTEIEDEIDGVSANIIEGGALKMLNANENVKYEIHCDETNPAAINVLDDGMNFIDKLNYLAESEVSLNDDFNTIMPLAFRDNDTANFGIVNSSSTQAQAFSMSDVLEVANTTPNYVMYPVKSTPVSVNGRLVWYQASFPEVLNLNMFIYTSLGNRYDILTNTTLSTSAVNPTITTFSGINFTLAVNEKAILVLQRTNSGGGPYDVDIQEGSLISFGVTTKNDESTCFALRPLDLLKQLVSKMTDGKYTADSDIFTVDNNKVVTCGDALKNSDRTVIPNYVLATSFSDFFKSYDAMYMAAVSVQNNVIRFDRRQTVYDSSTVTMNAGEVSDHKILVAKDYLVNRIIYGYPDQNYGNKVGRYEVNSSAERKMPVSSVDNDYDITSVYRADPIGIELIRSKFTVIDASSPTPDKEVFILAISNDQDVDGNYLLDRPNWTSITGVFDDTVYNVVISPTRNLQAHGAWLRSLTYFLPSARVTFQTAIKNAELVTTIGGVTVSEKANLRVDSLAAPLFYPYIFTFKTKVPINFISLMTDAINGHIAFQINGRQFYGFPLDVSVNPGFEDEQTWKVLASTMNDISQLQDLEPDPLNNLDMANYGLSVAKSCPVKFLPANVQFPALYHYKNMDADFYINQLTDYASRQNYFQKWQTNDSVDIQCFTNGLGPVQVDIVNCKGQNFGTFPLTQKVSGAVAAPYALFEGSVTFAGIDPGTYYMLISAGTGGTIAQMISEPFKLAVDWPLTLLYKYKNTRNRNATIFSTGYNPSMRVEGTILNFLPGAKFSTYEDEPLDFEIIEGIPYRKFTLKAGEVSLLPPWVVDKLNRIMSLDTTYIDGIKYARTAEEFEPQRFPGVGSAFWSLGIRQSINGDADTVNTDGTLENSVIVFYNIETRLFGDLTNQVSSNVVQVEELEDTQ